MLFYNHSTQEMEAGELKVTQLWSACQACARLESQFAVLKNEEKRKHWLDTALTILCGNWDIAQSVKGLPWKCDDQSWIPCIHTQGSHSMSLQTLKRQRKEDSCCCWPASLNELGSSRFSVRSYLEKSGREGLRETPRVNFQFPYTSARVCTRTTTHIPYLWAHTREHRNNDDDNNRKIK